MSDAELVQTWIRAWAHARSAAVTDVDGWPLVHLGSVTRENELICHEPGTRVCARLLAHVAGDPRAMLTVLGRDLTAYDQLDLPADVTVTRHDEVLMTTDLVPLAPVPIGSDFATGWDQNDNSVTFWIEQGGRIAAEGSMGMLDAHATFDGIETTPRFRRRGLGRHVMATLSDHALAAGARHGILAASLDGRRLYESIGWIAALQMRSFMGTAPSHEPAEL